MRIELITRDIWPQLTQAAKDSRRGCAVAVAYFAAGASRLLPLPKGSRLVVDASDRAVASGQTCPAELIKLMKKGVTIYSVPNLHAKVFVLGRTAYIGSANVSNRSASQLIEAVVCTTEPTAVRAAREFVEDHCLYELTPAVLTRLSKIYRPPIVPGGPKGKSSPIHSSRRPTLPRIHLAQLEPEHWSPAEQEFHDTAFEVAEKRQRHPDTHQMDSFRWSGRMSFRKEDLVLQVTNEGDGRIMVSPPGNVRYMRSRQLGSRQVNFVFLERPARKRRRIETLAKALGDGAHKKLIRRGLIRDVAFAEALLKVWAK